MTAASLPRLWPRRRARPSATWHAGGALARPRVLRLLLLAVLGAMVLIGAGTAGAYAVLARDLPEPGALAAARQFESTKIYDRNGELLHEVYDPNQGRRTSIALNQVPEPAVKAFLAAEDARFYQNPGVDFQGIARAFFENVRHRGERLSGGSTITQQLVKNTLLTDERTLRRKMREAILALRISRQYSKDQILERYLNSVYFGHQAYGIQTAAETYFAKPASELSLAEGALLAGLVRAPSATNPFKDERAAKAEQKRVLDLMVRHGFVQEAEAAAALAQPLAYNDAQFAEIKAPHFVLWVRDQLEANPKYGRQALYQQGLSVTTTLDLRLQSLAEQAVRAHVASLARYNASNAALVALNPATGEILAMVGSADFHNNAIQGEVNVALALRQPGSAIKPFTYLAAFQQGWTPATVIDDVPTTFPGHPPYTPKNYDGQFHGRMTVRSALANSYNIPAVKALQFVGVPALIDLTRRAGITTFGEPSRYGLALTLGGGEVRPLELTSAYGVLAHSGQHVPPVSILRVTDARGQLLDEYPGPRPIPVVAPGQAFLITSILSDNEARTPAFGARSALRLSRPVAAKTGTTDDSRDNWTVGYTSQLVVGVWVGNADNTPMRGTTGLTGAAPIWHDVMEAALAPLPVDPLAPPPGVRRVALAAESGRLWTEGCPEPKLEEWLAAGMEPRERCEAPTPTATYTAAPATPTVQATRTVVATRTPPPSVEELRQRAAATSTALAEASLARQAQRQATVAALITATTPPSPASPPAQLTATPATEVRGTQATTGSATVERALPTPTGQSRSAAPRSTARASP